MPTGLCLPCLQMTDDLIRHLRTSLGASKPNQRRPEGDDKGLINLQAVQNINHEARKALTRRAMFAKYLFLLAMLMVMEEL